MLVLYYSLATLITKLSAQPTLAPVHQERIYRFILLSSSYFAVPL